MLRSIGVILMCRDPDLKFCRRIKYVKKDNALYMDIMLDLNKMMAVDSITRRKFVLGRIVEEIPVILQKYKDKKLDVLNNFDVGRLASDLNKWFFEGGVENNVEEYGRYVQHLKGDF